MKRDKEQKDPRWQLMGQAARQCASERAKEECVDMWEVSVFMSVHQLYSTALLGIGGPGSPGQAAFTTAEISPAAAGSAPETMPS